MESLNLFAVNANGVYWLVRLLLQRLNFTFSLDKNVTWTLGTIIWNNYNKYWGKQQVLDIAWDANFMPDYRHRFLFLWLVHCLLNWSDTFHCSSILFGFPYWLFHCISSTLQCTSGTQYHRMKPNLHTFVCSKLISFPRMVLLHMRERLHTNAIDS